MTRDVARWDTSDSLADIRAFYQAHARCTDTLATPDLLTMQCVLRTETKEAIMTTVATVAARAVGPQQAELRVEQFFTSQGRER
jgi:hypothetical protein